MLILVLAQLMKDEWIEEHDLIGLDEDKIAKIVGLATGEFFNKPNALVDWGQTNTSYCNLYIFLLNMPVFIANIAFFSAKIGIMWHK